MTSNPTPQATPTTEKEWPDTSQWPAILREDDCSPDSKWYFNLVFPSKAGMAIADFKKAARCREFETGTEWLLNDMSLEFYAEDPFYTLRRKPQDPTPQGLPLERSRYVQWTPDGWQGADHPDGPWRPIPGPQTQPPFPMVVEVAGPSVAEIDAEWLASWCEETGRYDVVAFARAILARWGRPITPAAPEPLPTVRYEFLITGEEGEIEGSGDFPTLEEAEREGRRFVAENSQYGYLKLELRRVEVLSVSAPEPQPEPVPAAAEPPLWRVMAHAYDNAPAPPRDAPDDWTDRVGYAAEILAVRDRVAPEEPPPVAPTDSPAWLHWQQRQAIRALLTTEAARAERGE